MDFRSASKPGMVLSRRASRPCDVCGKERARWYCAADEAYLCERCDASVHSANSVARRHERVKLGPNGAPMKIERKRNDPSVHRKDESLGLFVANKSWQQGSRKRSQTTYPRPVGDGRIPPLPAVKKADPIDEEAVFLLIPKPEPCTPSSDPDADFLYPASTNQCSGSLKNEPASPEDGNPSGNTTNLDFGISYTEDGEFAHEVPVFGQEDELADEVPVYEPLFEELLTANHEDCMEGILPTTVPAYEERSWTEPERTCKVETFLDPGSGLCEGELDDMGGTIEDGSISIEGVSGLDEFDVFDLCTSSGLKSENCNLELPEIEMWRSPLECSNGTDGQDCIIGPNPFKGKGERQLESGIVKLEQDSDCMAAVDTPPPSEPAMEIKERILHKTISLRLNYEDVLSAWSDRGSFWTDGRKPQTVPDDSIFDIASLEVGIVPELSNTSSQAGEQPGQVPVIEQSNAGAAREARVMRYREKRLTRLFSKKIRYEVRKLNAERRPRMKGRFVKRSSPGL